MKLKARLKDLKGKYYHTIIEIVDEETSQIVTIIKVDRIKDSHTPSIRELELYGLTEEDWNNNRWIEDPKVYEDDDFRTVRHTACREAGLFVDFHYETKETYEIALKIVDQFNLNGNYHLGNEHEA
jgi:hypothetical protein